MKNMPKIKLGIVAGSTDWMSEEIAIKQRKKLIENYRCKYDDTDIYECQVCITDNEVNLKRALKELNNENCNALCIYYANYGPESAGTLLAHEFLGPVMIMGAAEEEGEDLRISRKDSLSGIINAFYATKLKNENVYITTDPIGTIEECVDKIREFLAVSRTVIGLKNLKLISFGPRPASYLAASAINYPLYDMGVDISEYSEMELYDSYLKHSEDVRINTIAKNMLEELGIESDNNSIIKMAQYELTMKDWIRAHKGNRNFVALSSTCWPAFPVNYGFSPCYVHSRLTSEGMPVACEVDEYGAISEYVGQCLSEETVTLLNINNSIPKDFYERNIKDKAFNGKKYELDDLFLGYHCGVTCSSRIKSVRFEKHFVNNQLIGSEKSDGTIHGDIVSGPVTLLRIQSDKRGKLMAYVAQGQVLPVDVDTYGGKGIIAVPQMRRFIKNVIIEKGYPNHVAVLFGHYGELAINTLKYMGIDCLDYNHPKEIPYNGENYYSQNIEWF